MLNISLKALRAKWNDVRVLTRPQSLLFQPASTCFARRRATRFFEARWGTLVSEIWFGSSLINHFMSDLEFIVNILLELSPRPFREEFGIRVLKKW
jgi:hypothetical protein